MNINVDILPNGMVVGSEMTALRAATEFTFSLTRE